MGWNAVISANVKVARTEEEKKNLEELCQKYKDESDFLLEERLKSYNVRTKQKVYIPNEEKIDILNQNKDYYYFEGLDYFDITTKTGVYWILKSLKNFYGISLYSYCYEEIYLDDMEKIIDNMKLEEKDYEERSETIRKNDEKYLETFKKSMRDYIKDIFEILKECGVKDNEILDLNFSIRLV